MVAVFVVAEADEVAADNFVFAGALDDFVVGDAGAGHIDAHVGWGMIEVATENAVEDVFEDWELGEVATVADGGFAVVFEVEVIDHVDVADVCDGGFVSHVDGVFEW